MGAFQKIRMVQLRISGLGGGLDVLIKDDGVLSALRYGSHFIVLGTPLFNLFAGAVRIQEPMAAETLEPNRGVEGFHIGVVGRFTRGG